MILNFVLSVNSKRGGKGAERIPVKKEACSCQKREIFTNAKMDAGKTVTLRPAPKEMG